MNLYGVTCASNGSCYAVGGGGTILVKAGIDGAWQPQSANILDTIKGVACAVTGICYAAGAANMALAACNSFSGIVSNESGQWAFYCQDSMIDSWKGIACTLQGPCYTVGGNRNWATIASNVEENARFSEQYGKDYVSIKALNGVACATSGTCYAVGSQGAILSNVGGGTTWVAQGGTTLGDLYGVGCSETGTCYAVGASNIILRTSGDSGRWTTQYSGTSGNLRGVACATGGLCYAVGDQGTILANTGASTSVTATTTPSTPVSPAASVTPIAGTPAPQLPLLVTGLAPRVHPGATLTAQLFSAQGAHITVQATDARHHPLARSAIKVYVFDNGLQILQMTIGRGVPVGPLSLTISATLGPHRASVMRQILVTRR